MNRIKDFFKDNSLTKRALSFWIVVLSLSLTPISISAHQSPNTLIFLDVSPKKIAMEIQLPISELELAFGKNLSQHPETTIERFGPELKEYLKNHIHAYHSKSKPWEVEITTLELTEGKYIETKLSYNEIVAHIVLKPRQPESTRNFILDYDVILHQVINHVALITIRNDWESGITEKEQNVTAVISWNLKHNRIDPLTINLAKGNWWLGFKSMSKLGMEHIKEGTDHLLFLLVLLLPATLSLNGKKWKKFKGLKKSIFGLLKIVTAFTIGHSITLIISTLNWFHLPSQAVEVLIAISILVSAIHAIYPIFPNKEIYIAASFGLIHGLAFATVLSNLNLDENTLFLSVLGFNLGIEMMQIFIITLIMPWIIILSQSTTTYQYFRISFAFTAIILASSWIAERVSGEPNTISTFILKATLYAPYAIFILAIVSLFQYFILTKKQYERIQ